jgi:hypothetical protein
MSPSTWWWLLLLSSSEHAQETSLPETEGGIFFTGRKSEMLIAPIQDKELTTLGALAIIFFPVTIMVVLSLISLGITMALCYCVLKAAPYIWRAFITLSLLEEKALRSFVMKALEMRRLASETWQVWLTY